MPELRHMTGEDQEAAVMDESSTNSPQLKAAFLHDFSIVLGFWFVLFFLGFYEYFKNIPKRFPFLSGRYNDRGWNSDGKLAGVG